MSTDARLDPRQVLRELGSAVVYISVTDNRGDQNIGTAFHVGDGWFATARHVIESKKIKKIGRLDITRKNAVDTSGRLRWQTTTYPDFESSIVSQIRFHDDPRIDAAIFCCRDFVGPSIDLEPMADLVAYNEFLLQDVLVLGYPPIPFAKEPFLVCVTAQVSAIIDHYSVGRRHFVVSGVPRGGFSGGVALTLNFPARTLGVITSALHKEGQPTELGFHAVLSSGVIVELLERERDQR